MPDLSKRRDDRHLDRQDASTALVEDRLAAVDAKLSDARHATAPQAMDRQATIAKNFEMLQQQAAKAMALAGPEAGDEVRNRLDAMRDGQQREAAKAFEQQESTLGRLAEAFDKIEQRQADERQAAAGKPQLAESLDRRHTEEQEAFTNLAKQATDTLERNISNLRERQGAELAKLATAVVQGGDLLVDEVRNLDAEQAEDVGRPTADAKGFKQGQTERTARRLSDYVDLAARALENRPSAEQVSRLRDRLGDVAQHLDDQALERIYAAAGVGTTDRQRADSARGQLAEELYARKLQDQLGRQNNPSLRFVPGDLIRDGLGRKLTDGVVLQQRDDKTQAVKDAWEVKSGRGSADSLKWNLRTDRSSEVWAAARDDVIRQLADESRIKAGLYKDHQSAEAARAHQDLERDDLDRVKAILDTDAVQEQIADRVRELQRPSVQAEAGQQESTTERLSAQRLFVEGAEIEQVQAEERRRTEVRAVLPKDVEPDLEADRLDQTEAELRAAADLVVDERRRTP
jgi:hypothetical protein